MHVACSSFIIASALSVSLALPGHADNRIAVVVGNQDYRVARDVPTAVADASAMAGVLRDLGFTVFDGYDVTRQEFEKLMRASLLNAEEGAEIVFFFAGHGVQLGSRNYLLPVDADFTSEFDLPLQSLTLDRAIENFSDRGAVLVAILDAFRENPFPNAVMARDLDASLSETREGFEVFQTPLNSLIAFSATPGMRASDGPADGHSPYTGALLEAIQAGPERTVTELLAEVRANVHGATSGSQIPWESSTLVHPFSFGTGERSSAVMMAAPDTAADKPPETDVALELPTTITLDTDYERSISIGPALADALGADALVLLSLAVDGPPSGGSISVGPEGAMYVPTLVEQRVLGDQSEITDTFVLATEEGARVEVTLQMRVNECDRLAGDALDPGGTGYFRMPNEIPVFEALTACSSAVEAAPDEPRFRYQLARAQLAAADYEAALANLEAARDAGHVRALAILARLMMSEVIDRDLFAIPADVDRAIDLLEEGVSHVDPFAMHWLGRHLLEDGETDEARARGFELLDRAAELGHTFSMNALGLYYITQDNPNYQPERGIRYFEASAERNDIYGFRNMGFVHLNGLEGEPDYIEAYAWFERAARGGHPQAPSDLGRMIVRGQFDADLEEAVRQYDIALERGDVWGGVNAAELIRSGDVDGHSAADALVRAAKAVHLSGPEEATSRAREIILQSPQDAVGRAIQMLLNELGADVTVDGAVGPQTRAAIAARAAEAGVPAPEGSLAEVLVGLGRVYRAENPIRTDVF